MSSHFYRFSDNTTIAYKDFNSHKSDSLVFIHGNSNSSRVWTPQIDSKTLSDYRIITPDLPGHGQSSAIASGDYSVINMASIMVKFVNAVVGKVSYCLVGLSLGGNVIAEMLRLGCQPTGIALISTGLVGKEVPVARVVRDGVVAEVLFQPSPALSSIQRYYSTLIRQNNSSLVDMLIEDHCKTRPQFRAEFPKSIGEGKYSDELDLVRKWGKQPLVVYGCDDQSIPPDVLDQVELPYWGGGIHKFTDVGHLVNIDQPLLFDELIRQYCQDVFSI
ncbi:alpha/beta hydrolase [Chryseolinea sp. T2]|uniref:alpha/beta fold hydrolase n=1 Tax=Chryseolinea sp. T2 TaxID=3129255 RepID=UPI0030777D07